MISFRNDIYPFLYKNFKFFFGFFNQSFLHGIYLILSIYRNVHAFLRPLSSNRFPKIITKIFFQVELLSKQHLSESGRYRTWFKTTSHLFRFGHSLCLFHPYITWNDKNKITINLGIIFLYIFWSFRSLNLS